VDRPITAGEMERKALHLSALVIPLGGFYLPTGLTRWILVTLTAAALAMEFLRLAHPGVAGWFGRIFGPMLKKHEKRSLTGSTYLLVSSTACFFLFDGIVAVAAVTFLILGDTAAALVGRRWGKKRFFNKSLLGTSACLLVCLLVGLLLPGLPRRVGAAGALSATIFELLPVPLDDNLVVPLTSGLLMSLF
jgi:dolichol kinase